MANAHAAGRDHSAWPGYDPNHTGEYGTAEAVENSPSGDAGGFQQELRCGRGNCARLVI